jgi:hypothetical protein
MKIVALKCQLFRSLLLVLSIVPLLAFNYVHEYYVSVTEIEYVKEQRSLQIISRIFIDDIEKLLRERYDESISLTDKVEKSTVNYYIEKYLKEKITIRIDDNKQQLNFIGKEYEDDIMFCYLEVLNIEDINTIEISNKVLFELYEKQQNIIKTKIKSKNKSFILINENPTGLINFN